MKELLDELRWRGMAFDQTPGLEDRLAKGPITGYVGFDPTATSLQIGNLVPVMLLAHLQRAGGKPIVLVGGGTGLIGDPSGKSQERPLLTEADVDENAAKQKAQLERFLDFGDGPTGAVTLNNADWLRGMPLEKFLRDVGKHFTISSMLQKDSVKSRLDSGISFTEFSYMLLQAYDFLHLHQHHDCELQLGGSDQWGNITAGIELIRRAKGAEAHALCAPLVTTSTGAKFGKTEAGSIWLDSALTSVYHFYQFWVNVDDRDVESYLKIFTFLSMEEVAELSAEHEKDKSRRVAQHALAQDLTTRIHGETLANGARSASAILFGGEDVSSSDRATWEVLSEALPTWDTTKEELPNNIVDLAAQSGLAKSKSEARRQIEQGGVYLNGERATLDTAIESGKCLAGGVLWLRRGKKTDLLVRVK